MKRKIIALCLVVAMLGVAVISGTMAYFTDTAEAVNVMTIGSVKIEQIEQQRDGSKLVEFKQGKELLPAVGGVAKYIDLAGKETDSYKSAYKFLATADLEPLSNAIDKIVTVKNTGRSDAYVRTIFGFEVVESVAELYGTDEDAKTIKFMRNDGANTDADAATPGNSDWTWEWFSEAVTINGQKYAIAVATHEAILEPKAETIPSLLQIYLKSNVEQEYAAKLGANYEVLTVSQGVQASGFASAGAALDEAFGDVTVTKAAEWLGAIEIPTMVSTPEELKTVLAAACAAKAGDQLVTIANDLDMTGVEWTPIYVQGYQGAGVVTLDGQGNIITGLTAPLFAGGFAGESGIIIKDLTIANSDIKSTSTQGAGAFIECVDSMETIILEDCHLLNSTVDAPAARTGGLVGWTSGYSNQNDGPVKTYVTIRDCTVIGNTITGTSVGGINGHAGASDWTYTTIENCTVAGNTLTSYDDGGWRVGAVIGTANIGEVTIKNVTVGKNTMTQPSASSGTFYDTDKLVGRFVPGSTGKLEISGTVVENAIYTNSSSDISSAISAGNAVKLTGDVSYGTAINNNAVINLNGNTFEATGTINLGNNADLTMTGGKYEVNGTYGHVDVRPSTAEGSKVVFEDVDFSFNQKNKTYGPSTNRLGTVVEVCAEVADANTEIVFKNCTFDNAQVLFEGMSGKTGTFTATFENCTFNALTSSAPIYVQNYVKGTLNVINCTFNLEVTSGSASAISITNNPSTAVTLNASGNTINATAATPYTYDPAKGETEVDTIKVNGTPANIKLVSAYANTTLNVTGTTATGIAVAN